MERFRRPGLALLFVAIMASVATACSGFSLFGGLAGGVLTVVAVIFWFATATTQSGCTVGPCLSPPYEEPDGGDAGEPDADVDGGRDSGIIGPCLTAPPPDTGVDLDAGVEVGALEPSSPAKSSRLAAIDRLREKGVLPADVAARLKGSSSNHGDGEA